MHWGVLMNFNSNEVFLVSGQQFRDVADGGGRKLSTDIEQRVVVAQNGVDAYKQIAIAEPGFRPLGLASLHEYEEAVRKLRATLNGDEGGFPLITAVAAAGMIC